MMIRDLAELPERERMAHASVVAGVMLGRLSDRALETLVDLRANFLVAPALDPAKHRPSLEIARRERLDADPPPPSRPPRPPLIVEVPTLLSLLYKSGVLPTRPEPAA